MQCEAITQNTSVSQTVPTPATQNKPTAPLQYPLGLTIALFAAALSGSLITLLALSSRTPPDREPIFEVLPVPPTPSLAPLFSQTTSESVIPLTAVNQEDLVIVEGIGPKIAELLKRNGVMTLIDLSRASPKALSMILKNAGPRFEMHSPLFWPEQARLLSEGKFTEFEKLKDALRSGKLK